MRKFLVPLLLPMLVSGAADQPNVERPNILWLVQEDTSPWMGCYGHTANATSTPHIDRLASQGVLFTRAFTPTPVCSTCRSSFITGVNAIRWGGHEHRSRRGAAAKPLQAPYTTLPELLQRAGYFTFNIGKTDYNFIEQDRELYAAIPSELRKQPWRATPEGRPFFGQIQLQGGKTGTRKMKDADRTDPADVTVPADYPQNDLYRETVAQHCDAIRLDDQRIGRILAELEADGLTNSTIVVYFSDHGANNLTRHKQMPTEGGLHVPCMFRGPAKWVPQGVVRDDLINILDVTATTLAWAGVDIPEYMEGHNLLAEEYTPRPWVAAAKDRLDHTIDRVRSIRTDRYRYTRNYFQDRILLQPQYRDPRPAVKFLHEAYWSGTLAPHLAEIYFGERPAEELYDVINDPAQVRNLANDPVHGDELTRHRLLLDAWIAKGDAGAESEPNIELEINGWARWGKGVNPEYERIRTDDDGDGLSSRWEEATGRDPNDGKLLFTFDCGGWQTEGWTSPDILEPLAGRLGTLEFALPPSGARLQRTGLALKAASNQGRLSIRLQSDHPLQLWVKADDQLDVQVDVPASESFTTVAIGSGTSPWTGTLHQLELHLKAEQPNTRVRIDHMEISP